MNKKHQRVHCSICHEELSGIVPKGGNGSMLFPLKHYKRIYTLGKRYYRSDEICEGTYIECEETKNEIRR